MSLTPYQRRVLKDVSGVSCDEDAETVCRAIDRLLECKSRPSEGWVEVMGVDWVAPHEVRVKRGSVQIDAHIEEAVDTYGEGLLVQIAEVLLYCPAIDPMHPDSPVI